MQRVRRFVGCVRVTQPSSVRRRDVQRFVTQLLADGLKAQTVNNYLSAISQFFRYAATCDHVLENPARGVPRLRQKRNPVRPYSAEEVEKILSLAEAYSEALWLIMLGARYTGLRAKELRELLWEDIDFDAEPLPAIHVRPSKHTKEVRTIPMHPKLAEVLRGREQDTGHVFLSPKGCAWTGYNLNNRVRTFRERHGLEDVGLHRFRKTLATEILRTTGNLKLAKEMLRHQTLQVTDEYYTVLHYDDLCRSVLAVEPVTEEKRLRIVRKKSTAG